MKVTLNRINRVARSWDRYSRFALASSVTLALLAPVALAAGTITGTATRCSGLASCYFALSSTSGSGWASTSAGVPGYVGQSPLNFSGVISFQLPGESVASYNGRYQGTAVLDGYNSTAGTLYHVTGSFSAIDADTGTIVTGSTDSVIGIKGHSGRGGGIYFTLVRGSITLNTSSLRASATSLVLNPSSVVPGGSTTCSVTVTDPGAGSATTPTGTVTFTQSSSVPGTFSATSVTLASGTGSVAFQVTNREYSGYYVTITASYSGDSVHEPSSASVNLLVSGGGGGGDGGGD